ncbi:adenosylcobinamide-phosphate synthase CbiB [Aestuariivirga sp.]|uniref:adenosylcobinamide-phosphate synthase CbiB n=1 Tax=Aestuariivirga sp. TaxID=2650926 RepID=UPI0039E55900
MSSAAAIALLVERFAGYPKPVYAAIGHPVEWMGRLITLLDHKFNVPAASQWEGRLRGVAALAVLLAACAIPAWIAERLVAHLPFGWIINPLIATGFLAQKSLRDHVQAVYEGLGTSLAEGRRAVSQIVGRDPATLDESAVSRAALESLGENASDGIVAPALWYALLGLPGIVAYKAINTADSMIGHKSERYLHFGWASARLDDVVNLPASRLCGALFAISNPGRMKTAFHAMWRDAPKHQSPNAGWPEASLAASLGLRFGGPRSYHGELVDLPWMGEGRSDLTRDDIRRGLVLYGRMLSLLLALACAWWLF